MRPKSSEKNSVLLTPIPRILKSENLNLHGNRVNYNFSFPALHNIIN
jgi:hypothetical protein